MPAAALGNSPEIAGSKACGAKHERLPRSPAACTDGSAAGAMYEAIVVGSAIYPPTMCVCTLASAPPRFARVCDAILNGKCARGRRAAVQSEELSYGTLQVHAISSRLSLRVCRHAVPSTRRCELELVSVDAECVARAHCSRPPVPPDAPRAARLEWKLSLDSLHTNSNLTPKADDRTILQSSGLIRHGFDCTCT